MSIASYARRSEAPPRRGAVATRETSRVVRMMRIIGLAAQLARMWLAAARVHRLSAADRRDLILDSARRLLGALGIEVVVRGRAPDPRRPVLLVANHVSWLDSYAIHAVADARFVAKSEVRTWPAVGTIAARFGTLFLKRGSRRDAWRVMKRAAVALRRGSSVAVFPEGTTTVGDGVGRFHPAFFQAALEASVPVQPLTIRYYGADGRRSRAAVYVDDMSIAASVASLVREPRLVVEVVFGAPIEAAGRRRALCGAAESAVREALALPRHWIVELGADRRNEGFPVAGGRLAGAARA